MKKAIFVLLLLLSTLSFQAYSQTTVTGGGEVSFVMANKKKCNCICGIGFRCSGVELKGNIQVSHTAGSRHFYAGVGAINANTWVMRINKATDIPPALYQEVFAGKSSITTEEDWDLPQNLLTLLNYQSPFLLKAGTYAVQESDGFINITLTR
ncbi:MAG: hypothetical protein EAZ57_07740 [Cytophagales bacterium]|nr:MAG: hypothetical protein EAZ67_08825 [Cytophagales bacterium]TAF60429.1 MAG: hypothetical protein EAZ57_07740 [Cytophagales bacterium]